MENNRSSQIIIDKINKGIKFGLYEKGRTCYFDDGTYVSYNELWTALRIMQHIETGHKKNLSELCPDTYKGVFNHKFIKFRPARFVAAIISKALNPKLSDNRPQQLSKATA